MRIRLQRTGRTREMALAEAIAHRRNFMRTRKILALPVSHRAFDSITWLMAQWNFPSKRMVVEMAILHLAFQTAQGLDVINVEYDDEPVRR